MSCAECSGGGWILDWGACPVRFAKCPKCRNASQSPKPYIVPDEVAPQGSDRWKRLHIGRITAGRAHHVVTEAKLELAKGRFTIMYRLAAERLLNLQFDRDLTGNEFIEHGMEHEADAIWQYKKLHKVNPRKVSFIFSEDERSGCSPDSLNDADDRYAVEAKCPQPPQMVRLHIEGPGSKYRAQILHQFSSGRLDRNDLFAFHPWMPPYWQQWNRDQVKNDVAKVAVHIDTFNNELEEMVDAMKATGFFTPLAIPTTALGQLVERLEEQIVGCSTIGSLDAWESSPETTDSMRSLPIDERERLYGMAAMKRCTFGLSA